MKSSYSRHYVTPKTEHKKASKDHNIVDYKLIENLYCTPPIHENYKKITHRNLCNKDQVKTLKSIAMHSPFNIDNSDIDHSAWSIPKSKDRGTAASIIHEAISIEKNKVDSKSNMKTIHLIGHSAAKILRDAKALRETNRRSVNKIDNILIASLQRKANPIAQENYSTPVKVNSKTQKTNSKANVEIFKIYKKIEKIDSKFEDSNQFKDNNVEIKQNHKENKLNNNIQSQILHNDTKWKKSNKVYFKFPNEVVEFN